MSEQRPIELVRDPMMVVQRQRPGEATTQVQYVSQGHCLVIGDPALALSAAAGLSTNGYTVVHVDTSVPAVRKRLTEDGVAVFTVPALSLSGYLGAYRATVPVTAEDTGMAPHPSGLDLAVSVYRESGLFDVVLDLSEQPVLPMRLSPFGYRHATSDESIRDAIDELNDLKGEFEKPRYFNYDENICAHSRSQLDGCHQCIDVCAAGAIVSHGEGIQVDPFLCQGCGSCATVCPSGALSYAYPRPADAIERTRLSMQEQGAHTVILHTEAAQTAVSAINHLDGVLSLLVEEVSAFGPDYWLALLAGPCRCIVMVLDAPADDPNRLALERQRQWTGPLLAALGIPDLPVHLVASKALGEFMQRINGSHGASNDKLDTLLPRAFATHNDKRQTIRLSLDALSEQLLPLTPVVDLPAGAPFGAVKVDKAACTLCMACVSTCPAKALQDGQDAPALRFVEANCVQCGLCEKACPESAISLEAHYTWDSIAARKIQTLHEETPFHCVRCHTPFTTQAMIDTMTAKLAGHWMFQDEKAMRRLRLCGDCRVRDIFEGESAGIDVHRDPS
jgi:ferredoxin